MEGQAYMPVSQTVEWETPLKVFWELDDEFHFQLDVCATPKNAKCLRFYTKEEDGLLQDWTDANWMNPPYGREMAAWVKKASQNPRTVCLLPARTDTRWFHEFVYQKPNVEVRFIKGRLKFGGNQNSAPFPSMVVIFN